MNKSQTKMIMQPHYLHVFGDKSKAETVVTFWQQNWIIFQNMVGLLTNFLQLWPKDVRPLFVGFAAIASQMYKHQNSLTLNLKLSSSKYPKNILKILILSYVHFILIPTLFSIYYSISFANCNYSVSVIIQFLEGMITCKSLNKIPLLKFKISNLKLTSLKQQIQQLKKVIIPPQQIIKKPTEQTLFRTAAQQALNKIKLKTKTTLQKTDQQTNHSDSQPQSSSLTKINNILNQNHNNTQQIIKNYQQKTYKTQQQYYKQPGIIVDRNNSNPESQSQLRILHEKNIGLNLFINRVYITTGCSMMMTLGTIYMASSIPYFVMNPFICLSYGTMMTVVGMLGAYYIKPHIVIQQEEGYQHIKTRNGILRSSLFVMGWAGLGLFSMPFANMVASFMPMIIPNLMMMTLGCFGGASLMIAAMPRLPLFAYGGFVGGLIGSILSMQVMKKFNMLIFGQNFISSFIQAVDMYGGSLVFTFFVVYNTIKAKEAYEAQNPDHFEISIRFYYDMLNFVRKILYFIFRKKVD